MSSLGALHVVRRHLPPEDTEHTQMQNAAGERTTVSSLERCTWYAATCWRGSRNSPHSMADSLPFTLLPLRLCFSFSLAISALSALLLLATLPLGLTKLRRLLRDSVSDIARSTTEPPSPAPATCMSYDELSAAYAAASEPRVSDSFWLSSLSSSTSSWTAGSAAGAALKPWPPLTVAGVPAAESARVSAVETVPMSCLARASSVESSAAASCAHRPLSQRGEVSAPAAESARRGASARARCQRMHR